MRNIKLLKMPAEIADSCGLYRGQTTKVRVISINSDGIEVINRSKNNRVGFIKNDFLKTRKEDMQILSSLYVYYLGEDDEYLHFCEDVIYQEIFNRFEDIYKWRHFSGN
ncbi:hypothetical protein AMS59_07650 [Lysinibacillus sp. FJAT-14745]|uniref:hypothetical protein n=1 Tax=Lysinibacillus sp. FJAT-14745 TaxID=1704289 RepID=UPI0006ABCB9C|nr:hypothetical protein [Lysinibacillus sp. FJAT-14745]KOP78918.1 hypothetical protein AMS59_07650 [Lysinibacillus sp. FJAT-14745]